LSHTRYTLKDPEKFRWLMKNPGRGRPYSVRELADACGCGHGLIQKLANGKQPTAGVLDAHAIAEALGVAVLVLFMPPVTPNRVTVTTDDS
jgi:transcriptional regulator with XRE-family HTH domain